MVAAAVPSSAVSPSTSDVGVAGRRALSEVSGVASKFTVALESWLIERNNELNDTTHPGSFEYSTLGPHDIGLNLCLDVAHTNWYNTAYKPGLNRSLYLQRGSFTVRFCMLRTRAEQARIINKINAYVLHSSRGNPIHFSNVQFIPTNLFNTLN